MRGYEISKGIWEVLASFITYPEIPLHLLSRTVVFKEYSQVRSAEFRHPLRITDCPSFLRQKKVRYEAIPVHTLLSESCYPLRNAEAQLTE